MRQSTAALVPCPNPPSHPATNNQSAPRCAQSLSDALGFRTRLAAGMAPPLGAQAHPFFLLFLINWPLSTQVCLNIPGPRLPSAGLWFPLYYSCTLACTSHARVDCCRTPGPLPPLRPLNWCIRPCTRSLVYASLLRVHVGATILHRVDYTLEGHFARSYDLNPSPLLHTSQTCHPQSCEPPIGHPDTGAQVRRYPNSLKRNASRTAFPPLPPTPMLLSVCLYQPTLSLLLECTPKEVGIAPATASGPHCTCLKPSFCLQ